MDICSRLTCHAPFHLCSHISLFSFFFVSSHLPHPSPPLSLSHSLFSLFHSCCAVSLRPPESCNISLGGITASSPMKYKCLSLSFSYLLHLSHLHRKRERRTLMRQPIPLDDTHVCAAPIVVCFSSEG